MVTHQWMMLKVLKWMASSQVQWLACVQPMLLALSFPLVLAMRKTLGSPLMIEAEMPEMMLAVVIGRSS